MQTTWTRARLLLAGASAVLAVACGGDSVATSGADAGASGADADAIAQAEANLGDLESAASDVRDIEVLDVADGSIATLREAVDGDRPVLLWFFSPH